MLVLIQCRFDSIFLVLKNLTYIPKNSNRKTVHNSDRHKTKQNIYFSFQAC